jgi:hypothetical protein
MSDLSAQLRAAIARLEGLDLAQVQQDALERGAERLRDDVRRTLSAEPGDDHSAPWRRTGALRDGIDFSVDAGEAAVGSADPVAVDQELGTRHDPPRPFLAPAATAAGAEIATDVADAVAAALRAAVKGAFA